MHRELTQDRHLLETLPVGVCVHVEGRIVYANAALVRMTRAASSGAAVGRSILDYVHPDFHAATRDRVQAIYDKKHSAALVEVVFLREDGTTFPADVTASMVDWHGRPAGQVVVVDVTRRKEAERAQCEVEDRYGRLLAELPLGIVVHSEGRLVYANHEAARLVGAQEPSELVGTDVLAWIDEAELPNARRRLARLYAKEGNEPPQDIRIVRKDGSPGVLEMTTAMCDWQGRPAGQVLMADVTERRRAAAMRKELDRRVQQSQKNDSMEVLAGGVAHDFNNLLVGILGHSDLALSGLDRGSEVGKHVAAIATGARRAADLARQMLAYTGRGAVATELLDLGLLLAETRGLIDVSVSKKTRLVFDLADSLPHVEGDPTQIRQVVMNLIGNAADALGESEGTIRVATGTVDADEATLRSPYVIEAPQPGCYVYVDVSDDGVGMSELVLQRIFDPFFSTKRTGRGLGLAASLGIVRAHSGTVQVESQPGRGTRFRVLLPAANPKTPVVHTGGEAPRRRVGPGPATILLVDDEPTVRLVASTMLHRAGFSVVEAEDGRAAVEIFAARHAEIDCVLLDLAMPRMNGREALRELRRIRPDVAVLLCSGYPEQDMAKLSVGAGRTGFLAKPFETETLVDAIAETLD